MNDVSSNISGNISKNIPDKNSISVIDYANINSGELLAKSLHEIGFSVLFNHGLDNAFIQNVYDSWKDFFKYGNKTDFEFDQKTHDGYVSFEQSETAKGNDTKDLKAFYHYYKSGRCPDNLRKDTDKIFDILENMACELLISLENYLPKNLREKLHMPLEQMVKNSGHSLLRPIYYPSLDGSEPKGAIRSAPHEDIDMLTLIAAPSAPGLQVKDSSNNWLDVPCDSGYLVINSGDLLAECTNNFYPSTTHRVINPSLDGKLDRALDRVSMPLFLHPHDHIVLSDRHTAASFRRERFIELGLIDS